MRHVWNTYADTEALEGRTISEIWIKDREHQIAFVTAAGDTIIYGTHAGCCSETWFADFRGVRALLHSTIYSVESIDMDETAYSTDDGRSRQEYDQAYGYKIKSEGGYSDLIFRNSSNGYYGGHLTGPLDFEGDPPDVQESDKWRQITDDWVA